VASPSAQPWQPQPLSNAYDARVHGYGSNSGQRSRKLHVSSFSSELTAFLTLCALDLAVHQALTRAYIRNVSTSTWLSCTTPPRCPRVSRLLDIAVQYRLPRLVLCLLQGQPLGRPLDYQMRSLSRSRSSYLATLFTISTSHSRHLEYGNHHLVTLTA
jgi:hypothetical protein